MGVTGLPVFALFASLAAAEPAPFMAVELKMAPFKGANAEQTRRKAEAFLAKAGYEFLEYQDNEAVRAATIVFAPGPEGPLAGIRRGFEKMGALRALRAKPCVLKVVEYEGGKVGVYFLPFVYRPQVEALREILPEGASIEYTLNPAMSGLWVELDVSGEKDPPAAAREFARSHPAEVESADIKVKVEVFKAETR